MSFKHDRELANQLEFEANHIAAGLLRHPVIGAMLQDERRRDTSAAETPQDAVASSWNELPDR